MSKIEVDAIDKQSGSTLTLGGSGTAVTLGTGATQSGFGRNGSVNWQTTIKTGDFTAASGEGYFINTTAGTITLTLPSSPSVGDIVAFKDYAGTFQTNNLTIDRNGSNVVGGTDNPVISTEGQAVILVYGDATQGWQPVEAATNSDLPRPSFMSATGGTITTSPCGSDKIHTFTGPGTFTVSSLSNTPANNQVSYLVVGGGGGSARVTPCSPASGAGGGGAGGFREDKSPVTPYTASPLEGAGSITVTATGFPIVVGGGGDTGNGSNGAKGGSGGVSTFSTITSAGGGGGSNYDGDGAAGASGGGGRGTGRNGGTGNSPPTNPAQGKNGGGGAATGTGGGGGGATALGTAGSVNPGVNAIGGPGGAGATTSINGSPTAFAGGGGGSSGPSPANNPGGTGGTGGGGNGGTASGAGQNGTDNTGGGGGGGQSTGPTVAGHTGGSGIVIIRYKFQ